MYKKIIGIVLTLCLGICVLTGCNLFEQNTRKNYTQVVAEIDSIEETGTVGGRDVSFKSEPKKIYKYELVSSWNQNGANLIQNGMSAEDAVDYLLEQLITGELIFMEADRMIAFYEMEWRVGEIDIFDGEEFETVIDYTDYNRIKELVYDAIDSSLATIRNEILSERGNDIPTVETGTVDSETTYPVKEEDDSDVEEVREEKPFKPDLARYPGMYGDADTKGLGRETMRRFIQLLKNNTDSENNYSVTAEDTEKFREDDKAIEKCINERGLEYVYEMLYDTHYIDFLLRKNAERQVKLERIQAHISDGVEVTPSEVQTKYNSMVAAQKLSFDADEANFTTAIKDGKEEILYFPNSRYFYVKHILLPFSKEQTARLDAVKKNGAYSDEEIESFRQGLVAETVVYPHKNGENDMTRPMTVTQVFNEIKSAMKTVENNAYEAERLFDDFIYLYNTDDGIFNNAKGYVVEEDLLSTETETYMKEFAEAARVMKKSPDYKPGMVLDYYAVTDYGVHIMYYANDTYAGEQKSTEQYQTPGRYKTYYDIIEESIKTTKQQKEFENWQGRRITYYRNVKQIYRTFEKRYADLTK